MLFCISTLPFIVSSIALWKCVRVLFKRWYEANKIPLPYSSLWCKSASRNRKNMEICCHGKWRTGWNGATNERNKKIVHDSFVMHTTWRSFNTFYLHDTLDLSRVLSSADPKGSIKCSPLTEKAPAHKAEIYLCAVSQFFWNQYGVSK